MVSTAHRGGLAGEAPSRPRWEQQGRKLCRVLGFVARGLRGLGGVVSGAVDFVVGPLARQLVDRDGRRCTCAVHRGRSDLSTAQTGRNRVNSWRTQTCKGTKKKAMHRLILMVVSSVVFIGQSYLPMSGRPSAHLSGCLSARLLGAWVPACRLGVQIMQAMPQARGEHETSYSACI